MSKKIVGNVVVIMLVGLFVFSALSTAHVVLNEKQTQVSQRYEDKVGSFRSAPQLTWRFANPHVVSGNPNYFVFDVEMKCDVPGTFHRDLQVYLNYNPEAFGYNIVANGKITLSSLYLMNNQPSFYYYVNDPGADNTPIRYALLTANIYESNQPGSPVYFTEVPTAWTGLTRFQLEIADASKAPGISFSSLMDSGQYYQNTSTATAQSYAIPSLYENDLLTYPFVQGDLAIISLSSTSATIQNKGSIDTITAFQTTIYGAPQWTNTPFKIPLYTETIASLAAGATTTITYSVPSYYYYGIIADVTNTVLETNENNNKAYIPYP